MVKILIVAEVLFVAAAFVLLAVLLRNREPEHEGATVDSPPFRPAVPIEFDEPPAGRHHEETVEIVPPDYRPPAAPPTDPQRNENS